MANIIGTAGDDLLFGSAAGSDMIDGGAGYDTIDYGKSNIGQSFRYNGAILFSPLKGQIALIRSSQINDFKLDSITNIEKVIGLSTRTNTISLNGLSSIGGSLLSPIDVDLSKNQVSFTTQDGVARNYSIINFDNVTNSGGNFLADRIYPNSRIVGNDKNNVISFSSQTNVVIASKGNDTIEYSGNSIAGKVTIDYKNIGNAIKYAITQSSANGPIQGIIDKGIAGKDSVSNIATIIGTNGQKNTVDWNTSTVGYDLNLAANSIQNRISGSGSIINFTDAIGGKGNDTIVGANKNSKLTGGGGNDTITGGNKNDIITGSDTTARGVGEVDTLTSGSGRDKFVLGDKNVAYYVGNGNNDYALITDFDLFKDSIDLGGFNDYSFGSGGNNTIELYSGKDVNTRDLIAKIQLGNSGSSLRKSSGSGIDGISAQINILSGASSIAETV
jgi:hypothetical protein